MRCRLRPKARNQYKNLEANAGHVVALLTDKETIVKPDKEVARPGRLHVPSVKLRVIIPSLAASVQRVVPGDIVIHRQGLVHRDEDRNPNQGPSQEPTKDADDNVGYVYDQLCTASEQYQNTARLEHHIFEGQWIARPSDATG